MKIFNWMQSKLSGKPEVKKQTSKSSQHHNQILHDQRNEEFSDWPHGLLAIGTFGNNDLKEKPQEYDDTTIENNTSSSDENHLDFTPEEVGKLQKELTKLLSRKPKVSEQDGSSLPLDKFLNCPSSLEVDRTICKHSDRGDGDGDGDDMIVLSNGQNVCMDKNRSIGKKSVTFLLKKLFVCRSGFGPTPSLADPIPESRIDKLLRTLLHKKILPQNTTAAALKKYLIDRQNKKEDETEEKRDSGAKWVKTDSEFIVLEI